MKTNHKVAVPRVVTHEGSLAERPDALQELRRTLSTCMLFENTFYEGGDSIANRLKELAGKVPREVLFVETLRAKNELHLRHAPLWMAVQAVRLHKGKLTGNLVCEVIQRADELAEIVSLYYKSNGKRVPLAKQLKRGIAMAFNKFNAYQLAKYNRDGAVKLRDVMFLVHPKPDDSHNAPVVETAPVNRKGYRRGETLRSTTPKSEAWGKLVQGTLESPDTWEVELSQSKDKKASWERLLVDGRLGSLALIRNLRNMLEARVDRTMIGQALNTAKTDKILPFQFIAAANNAPPLEAAIEAAMLKSLATYQKLPGKTLLVIDISGSMRGTLAGKSQLTRVDAANGIAILVRELAEHATIYATAGDDMRRKHATDVVPARRGFALSDAIAKLNNKLGGGGIFIVQCMDYIAEREEMFDRVIVVTDEQDCDLRPEGAAGRAKLLGKRNYIINVAPYKNGVSTEGKWTRINGFSPAVIEWIRQEEENPQWSNQ